MQRVLHFTECSAQKMYECCYAIWIFWCIVDFSEFLGKGLCILGNQRKSIEIYGLFYVKYVKYGDGRDRCKLLDR